MVMKIGGSLEHSARDILEILLETAPPVLIIPGGGRFADMVRISALPADQSHWMAIAAMDMFGWRLSALGADVTEDLCIPKKPLVFLPYLTMRRVDPLPHTWDITSDTIAAWSAHHLGLPLVVVKSVDGIVENEEVKRHVTCEISTDVVDPCLIRYVLTHRVPAFIVNGRRPERIRSLLSGESTPGTFIGDTL